MKSVQVVPMGPAVFRVVQHAVFRGARALDMLAAAAIVGMMALTCADIVMRFFRRPITGTYEIVAFLGALAVSLAVAHTSAEKGHVAVSLIVRLLPKRIQGLIEGAIAVLSLTLFALIAWQTVVYGLASQRAGEVSLTLGSPLFPVIYGVAFGTGAVCVVCLVDLGDAILKMRASSTGKTTESIAIDSVQRRDA